MWTMPSVIALKSVEDFLSATVPIEMEQKVTVYRHLFHNTNKAQVGYVLHRFSAATRRNSDTSLSRKSR